MTMRTLLAMALMIGGSQLFDALGDAADAAGHPVIGYALHWGAVAVVAVFFWIGWRSA